MVGLESRYLDLNICKDSVKEFVYKSLIFYYHYFIYIISFIIWVWMLVFGMAFLKLHSFHNKCLLAMFRVNRTKTHFFRTTNSELLQGLSLCHWLLPTFLIDNYSRLVMWYVCGGIVCSERWFHHGYSQRFLKAVQT